MRPNSHGILHSKLHSNCSIKNATVYIKTFKEGRVYGCRHINKHRQGRVGLQAVSVAP